MNPRFARFIAPAQAKPQLWRFVGGLVFGAAFYLIFTYVVIIVATQTGISIYDALNGRGGPFETSVLLFSFVGMSGGVILAARMFQSRSLMSLLGPDQPTIRHHFFIAVVVTFALSVFFQAVVLTVSEPAPNLPFPVWLIWLPSSLVLILIQTSAEELVFRGYIQQQLAARFSSRWIWWLLPSILFGMAHYEPETFGSNTWLVVADTTLFGLIAADITTRTGNLGGAIGLHFVNNALAFLYIAPGDDLNGLSLNISAFGVTDIEPMRMALIADFGLILIVYLVYLRIMRRRGF